MDIRSLARNLALIPGLLLLAAPAAGAPTAAAEGKPALTPAEVVAAAPATAWKDIPADELLVMTLAGARRVVIQLAPRFAVAHVANMRALALAHWWDGTSVYRVQDNYVAQWGDRTEKKPLPKDVPSTLPETYAIDRSALAATLAPLPFRDSYAKATGFADGWPVAMDERQAWLPHCYGMVGAGRNLSPDAGNGAELYAVIGHAPRQLDRNIALVGRVVEGIDNLSSLPRGTDTMGFYGPAQTPTPILSVRLASDMPERDRPRFQVMDTASPTFSALIKVRANRKDDFFMLPAGGADICNLPVPVRKAP
jgi:peptidylprolyl isomerase